MMACTKWHSIAVTLQTHIQEGMLSSNLSQVTGYPDRCFPLANFTPRKWQGNASESHVTTESMWKVIWPETSSVAKEQLGFMLDQGLFRTQTPHESAVLQQCPQPDMCRIFHVTSQLQNTRQFALHSAIESSRQTVSKLVIKIQKLVTMLY